MLPKMGYPRLQVSLKNSASLAANITYTNIQLQIHIYEPLYYIA